MLDRRTASLLLAALLGLAGCAKNDAPASADKPAASARPELGSFGVDLSARKASVEPGEDFFTYANGTWLDTYEIPADRVRWGAFDILGDRSEQQVRSIIEGLAPESAEAGTPEQQVGDYYASWMDTARVDDRGIEPLLPDLGRIAALSDARDLTAELGLSNYSGSASPIYASVGIDRDDPDRYILSIGLGGLGLPDRDYYLDDSERFVQIRDQYRAHIRQMLEFAPKQYVANADARAEAVLALETRIAELQWPRADRRDRDKNWNPTTLAELENSYDGFDWDAFFTAGGIEGVDRLNVAHPDLIEPLIALVREMPLDTWKAYLSYHLISNSASLLAAEIDEANFDFYGRKLSGQPQQRERWQRGVVLIGARESLGEALGKVYVERYFPESSKQQMEKLVENLRRAYRERIEQLPWMGEATKQEALAKLKAFRPKIGYPDKWQDLSDIRIAADDLFGNARRVMQFFRDFDAARLHRETDRDEWSMTPQTVNAYYNSSFNEIVFPAAILQPPFFDPHADAAVNYGAIGAVIGHEMGHGFDDQGSKSDARGVQRNWWTDADRAAFDARTGSLADQYAGFEAAPGVFVDGHFTLGENIGDLGGLSVAYYAYHLSLGGEEAPVIDGLTGDQRFFLGWAQVWKAKMREEALVQQLKSDPHSPARFRVNGVVRNVDAWYEAFGVTPQDSLYLPPEARVSIW